MMFSKFSFFLACTALTFACTNKKKTETVSAPTAPPITAALQSPAATASQVNDNKKPQEPNQLEALICKRAEENRSIEIEESQPQGCRLWYTRNGTRSTVASSIKAKTHCNQVQERIRANLENADFKCTKGAVSQNVVPAPVLNSKPAVAEQKK